MNFVLVHGAWHGGWCWSEVAPTLEARGHRAFAPTLRGLAHRADAFGSDIDADAHVDDLASLVEALDLHDIVLVLHSYAGLLGPALLARLHSRLRHIAWIEAVVPCPGQPMLELVAPEAAARFARLACESADGRLPVPDVAQFNLRDPALAERLSGCLTPHPLRTFTEPVRSAQADVTTFPGSYLIANDRDPQPYERFVPLAQHAGWPVVRVAGGHILMLTNPSAVIDFLLDSAGKPSGH